MANQGKLTNRDLADIFYKLLEGETVTRIADSYCVSEQSVYRRLSGAGVDVHSITVVPRCGRYPNLGKWMAEHKVSISRFAKATGMSYKYLRDFFDGKASPSFRKIQRILEVTGMTYEQAFATEETDVREES